LYHFRQALHLSETLKNDTLIAQHCNNIGMVYYQLGNADSALTYYERAFTNFHEQGLAEKAAIASLNLSLIYYDKGAYEKALQLGLAAIPELTRVNSLYALGSCYNTVALIYTKLSDHRQALEFHHNALAISK